MHTLSLSLVRSELNSETAVVALCAFSVANPLLAHAASFILPEPIGGLNIMQWFQGLCFMAVLATLPKLSHSHGVFSRRFSHLLWAYVIGLCFFHFRVLLAGRIPTDVVTMERMVYFKIIFALLFWYYASCLVQSHGSALALLRAILLGAVICAVWIIICYFSGLGGANYEAAGVKATAGSEGVSGKAMAGFLLPGAVGAIYLATRENSHRWTIAAVLIAASVFCTFDRSAQVACVVSLLWMVLWWLRFSDVRRCSKTVVLFVCLLCILGVVYYSAHGSEELVARWTRDFDRGEIGSGRGTFYRTACRWVWRDSSITDFFFGMGYGNILYLMHAASGIYRHTHSDLFDMLLIGGLAGLGLYFLVFSTIISLGKGMSRASAELAGLGALVTSYGAMSLLTGLMTFPHTMYAFGAQCICIGVLARPDGGDWTGPVGPGLGDASPLDDQGQTWWQSTRPGVMNFKRT